VEPLAIALIALIVALVLLVLWTLGSRPPRRTAARGTDEAEAEIEAHDIDQMIEARSERRRLAGREEIGEELGREALRRPPDR
jgi:hypothetical protein